MFVGEPDFSSKLTWGRGHIFWTYQLRFDLIFLEAGIPLADDAFGLRELARLLCDSHDEGAIAIHGMILCTSWCLCVSLNYLLSIRKS